MSWLKGSFEAWKLTSESCGRDHGLKPAHLTYICNLKKQLLLEVGLTLCLVLTHIFLFNIILKNMLLKRAYWECLLAPETIITSRTWATERSVSSCWTYSAPSSSCRYFTASRICPLQTSLLYKADMNFIAPNHGSRVTHRKILWHAQSRALPLLRRAKHDVPAEDTSSVSVLAEMWDNCYKGMLLLMSCWF